MTARRRHTARRNAPEDEDGERRPYRRQSPKMGPPAITAFVVVVLVLGYFGWKNSDRATPAEAGPATDPRVESNPFADLGDESGPKRGATQSSYERVTETLLAPEGLLAEPIWAAAVGLAEEGYGLAAEAEAAKSSGDDDGFVQYATRCRDLFDKAIEDTAEWEMEIQEQYGDSDRLVRKIMRERNKWFDVVKKYRKVSSKDGG